MGPTVPRFGPNQGEIANNQEPSREWFAQGALGAHPTQEIGVQLQSPQGNR